MRKSLLFFFLLSHLSILAGEVKTQFVIWAKDGTHICYALAEKPKVTFSENALLVSTKGIEVSYPLKNLLRFTVEDETITSLTDIQSEKRFPKLEGDYLVFPNIDTNSIVRIASVNGMIIFQKTIQTNGNYSYPISNLKSGIYLVTINDLSYKIIVK